MSAGIYDFYVEQGATFLKTITWKNSSSVAIDLTGYTARMQFRRSKSSTEVLFSGTTENGIITLGGSTGTIAINIPATSTDDFSFRGAVYDLELQSSGGIVTRLIEGSVELSKEVTRP
jgi:hypothetical protein